MTRDAFRLEGLPAISNYFARSPMISAFGTRPMRVPEELDLGLITSNFQRRMVQRDLQKSLPTALSALTDELVIIDLIDDRLRVAKIHGGEIALSTEAAKGGFRGRGARIVGPQSPDFLLEWMRAADRLIDLVSPRQVVLNKAFWAHHDETGASLDDRFDVALHNSLLARMYDHLGKSLNCPVVEYPDDLLIAHSQHQWGLSPFHYIEPFYEHFVRSIQSLEERFDGPGRP